MCVNYSMHDYSRDIMLATAQEHIETRMLLSAAENKSKDMEDSLRKLDDIKKKTEEILSQMIPKVVAERLRCYWISLRISSNFNAKIIMKVCRQI